MELPIDFVKLADAYGAKGFSTAKPSDVEKIIKQGFEEEGPVIMEFKIAREEKVLRMRFGISDRLGAVGPDEGMPLDIVESDVDEPEMIDEEPPQKAKNPSRKRVAK